MFGRFDRGFGWDHPQLTPGQQTARRTLEMAQRGLDAQFDAFKAQVEQAAQAGAQMPGLPTAVGTAFSTLLSAEAASKAADAAAAAPAAPSTTAPAAGATTSSP